MMDSYDLELALGILSGRITEITDYPKIDFQGDWDKVKVWAEGVVFDHIRDLYNQLRRYTEYSNG